MWNPLTGTCGDAGVKAREWQWMGAQRLDAGQHGTLGHQNVVEDTNLPISPTWFYGCFGMGLVEDYAKCK